MKFKEIAEDLGLPKKTVESIFYRAIKKIKERELILPTVWAVSDEKGSIRCCSAECDKEFITLYGDKK